MPWLGEETVHHIQCTLAHTLGGRDGEGGGGEEGRRGGGGWGVINVKRKKL